MECPICLEEISNENLDPEKQMAITACGHLFHFQCARDSVREQHKCPQCRCNITADQIIPCASMMEGAQKHGKEDQDKREFGTKLVAIRDVLGKIHADSDDQSIIFLQFQNILEKMRQALEKIGIKAFTLSGTVNSRTRTLQSFKQTAKSVLLLSLENSPSGMNLVNANHCLLVHPMFCESQEEARRFEEQAIGRICRQGQRKDCFVHRFVTRKTIEEDILREQHGDLVPPELDA
jgi:SNF2 family DNA or RNA helicase